MPALDWGRQRVQSNSGKDSAGQSNNNRGLIAAIISPRLNQISHIHGHLFNRGTVMLFNVLENSGVVSSNEVNSYTLSTKSSTSTNPALDTSVSIHMKSCSFYNQSVGVLQHEDKHKILKDWFGQQSICKGKKLFHYHISIENVTFRFQVKVSYNRKV